MKLSIIIANWNTCALIKQCIESVFAHAENEISSGIYELIVVDNGSDDGSKEYLDSLRDKISLIHNEDNAGYAPACNQGMRKAKGEFVLLLGSDTIIKENALQECVKFLEEHSEAGAVGCKLLNLDGSFQNSCKKFPLLKNAFYTYLSLHSLNRDYDMTSFKYDRIAEVEQIATTFLMIRKSVLESAGYFNERYRILYNDVDLCQKIRNAGWKIYFTNTVSIVHYGSHSTSKAGFGLRRIMYGDIYRFYKDNFAFKAVFLYPILVLRLLIVSSMTT